MNVKSLFISLVFMAPLAATAQAVSQSQIEQFRSLPQSQQQALAKEYGVDIDSLRAGDQQRQRPQNIEVVTPVSSISDDEREALQPPEKDQEGSESTAGLKPFGYDLFAGSPTTFAPVTEIPVPSEYTLGPGDVLHVQLWGKENRQLELPIGRDGSISFPQSGPQTMAGLTFTDARRQLRKLVSEQYIGVQASVTLGELRSMRVFVLGEARHPGSYTVSSLSTITNALYVSGGIKRTGSLRKVQHKRNGELVGQLDVYDLLLEGDSSNDTRLQPGDVIFIPPVGKRAGVEGEVYRPALYELKNETTLQQLIQLAGGLTPQAYPRLTRIERTNDEYLRILAEADLTKPKGQGARIQTGDRVTVASISEITGQYVEIKGAATRPGRLAWVPGMRVSSVIRSLDNDLLSEADKRYAALVRTDPATDAISVINLRIRDALNNPGSAADVPLAEKDQLLIFTDQGKLKANGDDEKRFNRKSLFAPVLQRLKAQAQPGAPEQTIRITGPVRYPGEYPLPQSGKITDAIYVAGGLTDNAFPKGAVFTRQELRKLEQQRLREAEERLQGDLLGVQLEGDSFGGQNAERTEQVQGLLNEVQSSRPVGRMVIDLVAVLEDNEHQSIRLQDGDTLTVPTIPQAVSVFGEVQFPTSHLHTKGLAVDDYLERSGGTTRQADDDRIYVVKADGSVMLPEKSHWFGGRSQQLEPGDTIIVPIDVDRLNQLELWTNVSQIVYQMALGAAAVGNL